MAMIDVDVWSLHAGGEGGFWENQKQLNKKYSKDPLLLQAPHSRCRSLRTHAYRSIAQSMHSHTASIQCVGSHAHPNQTRPNRSFVPAAAGTSRPGRQQRQARRGELCCTVVVRNAHEVCPILYHRQETPKHPPRSSFASFQDRTSLDHPPFSRMSNRFL